MKKTLYILENCEIKKEAKTIKVIMKDKSQVVPIETIKDIVVMGEAKMNKRLLGFLAQNSIMIHFFNFYEHYIGTFYPKNMLNSGKMVMKQSLHYFKKEYRLYLAKEFVRGSIYNIQINLKYFQKNFKKDLRNELFLLKEIYNSVDNARFVNEAMGKEGNSRDLYYEGLKKVINGPTFFFEGRVKRSPQDPVNSMISFGNAILYSTILSIIYQTFLDPRIGYLHSTNDRSFSLNLDIADIFKPIIIDRLIVSLINKKQIKPEDFFRYKNSVRLRKKGRKKFLNEYEKKLSSVIKYTGTQKKSYKEIIKAECYKLYKHFEEEEKYTSYNAHW